MAADAPDRQQCAVDVWGSAAAGVVTDAEALVGCPEDHLGRDDEARETDRMDRGAGDVGATGVGMPGNLLHRHVELRLSDLAQALGELLSCAAGVSGFVDFA